MKYLLIILKKSFRKYYDEHEKVLCIDYYQNKSGGYTFASWIYHKMIDNSITRSISVLDRIAKKTGLAIFCPITSQVKGYPFEVIIPEGFDINETILSDQIKNLEWKVREAEYIFTLPKQLLKEAQNKISTLLQF